MTRQFLPRWRLPRWRLTPAALWRLLLAISLLLVSLALGNAQPPTPPDDEAPTNEVQDSGAETGISAAAATVREVLAETDPQTPAELLRAVLLLQPLQAHDEAKRYLALLAAQDLDSRQGASLHAQFGSGRLVRLARDKDLAPEGRNVAMRILRAAREYRQNPRRIRSHVVRLGDESRARRGAARLAIAEAGAAAVPDLLQALREPPAGVSRAQIGRALAEIGPRAEDALIAALGGPDLSIQREAIQALGHAGSRRSVPHLWRPFFVDEAGLHQAARATLRQLGASPPGSPAAATVVLRGHVLRHLGGQPPGPADPDGEVELWTWSAEQRNVILTRVSARAAAAVAAARLARDMYELGPSEESTRLLLTSRLEVDQRLGGLDGPLPMGPGSAYQLAESAGTRAVNQVLAYCLEHELDAAALGACQLLGDLGDASLLFGAEKSPLVTALHAGNRRVRYAAARAIMSIDPRRPYPGSSHLLETLATLARVAGRPAALVGSPHQRITAQLSGTLAGLGFRVRRAANGNDFLHAAVSSSDFDVLILSDAVSRPPASETLQQVRKDPQSKYVPVILLIRAGQMDVGERLSARDDLVLVMPEFADRAALLSTLERAAGLASEARVPPARRLAHARDALQWMTHFARYSQTYPWYDLSRVHATAESVVFVPGLTEDALELLGYLGTEAAQGILVDMATSPGTSLEVRQRAANALTEAVLRHGLMLRKADVLQQYERYAADSDADPATQAIRQQILETIETQ